MTPTAVVFFSLLTVACPRKKITTLKYFKVTVPQWYYLGLTSENPIGLRLLDYLIFKKFSTTEVIKMAKVSITMSREK